MGDSTTLPTPNTPPAPALSDLYGDTGRLVAAPPTVQASIPVSNPSVSDRVVGAVKKGAKVAANYVDNMTAPSTARAASQAMKNQETQVEGEQEYSDWLYRNHPDEYKKANPTDYLERKTHDFVSNAVTEPAMRGFTAEQRQKFEPNLQAITDEGLGLYGVPAGRHGVGNAEGLQTGTILPEAEGEIGLAAPEGKKVGQISPVAEIQAEGPAWDRVHSAYDAKGNKIGSAGYKVDARGRAQIYGAVVPDKNLRGQGIMQQTYESIIDEARANPDVKRITSDSTNTTTGAQRVWQKIGEKGKAPVEEITHPNGKPGYQIDFEKSAPKKEATADPLEQLHGDTGKKVADAPARNPNAPEVSEGANAFNAEHGRPPIDTTLKTVSEPFAKELADHFEELQHDPTNPDVQKTYKALKSDIDEQWNYATEKMGVKFEPWDKEGQPYKNSREMVEDVKNNHHLYFFQGGDMPVDHPMAETDAKTGLTYNDKLRAVHDLFGHAAEGHQFGPNGEENAYQVHRQMFSPEAVPALTGETRAQNSWVNYGPHLRNEAGETIQKGEPGYVAPKDRPFAEQKAVALDPRFTEAEPKSSNADTAAKSSNADTAAKSSNAYTAAKSSNADNSGWHQIAGKAAATDEAGGIDPRTGKSDTKGLGVEIAPELRQALDHAPTAEDFQKFYDQHRDIFEKHPELRVGWDNNSAVPGGHEINVGAVGDEAARVGKKLDQKSAFDIEKGEIVPTGGTGLRTSFPNYPLEERMRELKGENPSDIKGFEHLSKDVHDHLEPDERDYLKGNKTLQRNVMKQYHSIAPSVEETTNAMQAGAALGGWWKRYIDIFHGLVGESEKIPADAWWHGTPSGDLRGGTTGLHVGTKEAATQALEARIGIRADGKPWDGTQEYGKTLLAGQKTLAKLDPSGNRATGYSAYIPEEDHYTTGATYSDQTPVALDAKPNLIPVKIKGAMTNSPAAAISDRAANTRLRQQINKGIATKGVYYVNEGEDAGSISAALPGPSHIEQIANTIGPSHAEVLKQWHAAMSGNKSVEDANNLAWHSYADWLDAGKPTDRKSINDIIKKNAAQPEGSEKKGNAAISDTLDKKGRVLSPGLDTNKLYNLVNSPEMRGERPFGGDVFREDAKNPLMGPTVGARKIPSMGATVAGKGNLNRLVIDAHIRDFYGHPTAGGPAAQYIADSAHLRQAAEALGLKGGEGQEQLWGTVLGLKTLLKEGLTPEEAGKKLNADVINKIGKDYAEVIANDPEITKPGGVLDRLKERYGIGRGSAGISGANRQASGSDAGEGGPTGGKTSTDTAQLAKTAERIRGQISESKIKKPAPEEPEDTSFNFGANVAPKPAPKSKSKFNALDLIRGLDALKNPAPKK